MVDVRGDVLRPPHVTTPAAVKSNIKSEMRSFKSNENIHKKKKPVNAICEQQRCRSACAPAQSDQRPCCSLLGPPAGPGVERIGRTPPPLAQSVETWPKGVRLVCRELRPVSLEERILVIERVGCGRHATHYFGLNFS